jgi:hypothetical protein
LCPKGRKPTWWYLFMLQITNIFGMCGTPYCRSLNMFPSPTPFTTYNMEVEPWSKKMTMWDKKMRWSWESLREHIGKFMGTYLAHIGNRKKKTKKIPLPPLKLKRKKTEPPLAFSLVGLNFYFQNNLSPFLFHIN